MGEEGQERGSGKGRSMKRRNGDYLRLGRGGELDIARGGGEVRQVGGVG